MANITLKGNACHTVGELPQQGSTAPEFKLTKTDLSDVGLADFSGRTLILNIFPSLDTPTCSLSVKQFNEQAVKHPHIQVLCISSDLPFAHTRFCAQNHLEHIVNLSCFRHPEFGKTYGVTIIDGPLQGLLARAVVVIDDRGKVRYTQLVSEIANEPDYDKALAATM
jgi:thiol peroxidase